MRKRTKDKRKQEGEKSEKIGKMVGDQTANQTAKSLKKGEKNHLFWNSRIAVLVVLMLLL
jgi:hypothetical protein